MNAQRTLTLLAALCSMPAWAENTAAALATSDDYVNAIDDRAHEKKSFFEDRFAAAGTLRFRVDGGDTPSSYAGNENQRPDTKSHAN